MTTVVSDTSPINYLSSSSSAHWAQRRRTLLREQALSNWRSTSSRTVKRPSMMLRASSKGMTRLRRVEVITDVTTLAV